MYSKDELYRIVFQERVSIRNQYRACSFGKLRVEPSSLGVVTARVNRNTFQSTNKNAVNDAAAAALAYVNSATGQSYESLTEYADMILYDDLLRCCSLLALPAGYLTMCSDSNCSYVTPAMGDFLAYASVGGGQSVYNDKWGGFVGKKTRNSDTLVFVVIGCVRSGVSSSNSLHVHLVHLCSTFSAGNQRRICTKQGEYAWSLTLSSLAIALESLAF
jgi:hypothetical protein